MSDIAERVKKIVVEHLGVEAAQVKEDAKFIDDLGAEAIREHEPPAVVVRQGDLDFCAFVGLDRDLQPEELLEHDARRVLALRRIAGWLAHDQDRRHRLCILIAAADVGVACPHAGGRAREDRRARPGPERAGLEGEL